MDWRPDASLAVLRLRARWLRQIRTFFEDRQVLEVETPSLSPASVPDPHIHSLKCSVAGRACYLQTSPELYMKRLLAAGSGAIYQVSRVYRDGEIGRLHNPEFTLLEWYQPGYTQQQLIDEVAELVTLLCDGLSSSATKTISYRQLFMDHAGVDPLVEDWAWLQQFCLQHSLDCPVKQDDWLSAMDWIMATVIQPALQGLTFVTHYPASQASLARIDPDDESVAMRFELFIDGIEMANGFEELTDVTEQRLRFESEIQARQQQGLMPVAIDERFLSALDAGMPASAGVALGLDRLLMWQAGTDNVRQAMSFGFEA